MEEPSPAAVLTEDPRQALAFAGNDEHRPCHWQLGFISPWSLAESRTEPPLGKKFSSKALILSYS